MMPRKVCPKCGKIYYGWALKYKECKCDCGTLLNKMGAHKSLYNNPLQMDWSKVSKVDVYIGGRDYEGGND